MPRLVTLRKHHFLQLTVAGSPLFDVPLQRSQLAFFELPFMNPIQMIKDGRCLHRRRSFQNPFYLGYRPDWC